MLTPILLYQPCDVGLRVNSQSCQTGDQTDGESKKWIFPVWSFALAFGLMHLVWSRRWRLTTVTDVLECSCIHLIPLRSLTRPPNTTPTSFFYHAPDCFYSLGSDVWWQTFFSSTRLFSHLTLHNGDVLMLYFETVAFHARDLKWVMFFKRSYLRELLSNNTRFNVFRAVLYLINFNIASTWSIAYKHVTTIT